MGKRCNKVATEPLRKIAVTIRGCRHVWTAPCGQALFGIATIAVGCSHVYGLLVQPFTTAGPDVVREGVLIS